MASQQLLGRFYLAASNTFQVASETAATLTAGNYFLAGYTSESTDQFCEHLQAKIRTISGQSTATVAYSASTGKVTITLDSSQTITMSSTVASILGFNSTSQSASATHVSDNQCRYVWRPSLEPANFPHDLDTTRFWNIQSTSLIGRSEDGSTWAVEGKKLYDAWLDFVLLPRQEVISTSSYTNQDFEQFWQDVAHAGQQVRIYPDRTANTSTDFVTAIIGPKNEDKLGSFQDFVKRYVQQYNGLWNVSIPLLKYISG